MTQRINPPLSEVDFELIETCLNGQPDPNQLKLFQEKIALDPNFASSVEEIRDLQIGIERAALANKLDSFHIGIGTPAKKVPTRSISSSWVWGIAASFFLLLTVGIWWILGQKSPEEKLFQAYFKPDPGLVTAMDSESDYEFDRAMVDYKLGSYNEAIIRWEKLQASNPQSDTLIYFLGAAYLASGEEGKALKLLESVAANPDSGLKVEASWYAGLASLKLGQNERALQLLSASSRPQVQELISKIESR